MQRAEITPTNGKIPQSLNKNDVNTIQTLNPAKIAVEVKCENPKANIR